MMQRYHVFVRCRELPAAHAEYTYSLDASSFHVAGRLGLVMFSREQRVRRRRLTCLELRITRIPPAPRREEIILPLGEKQTGGA